MAAEWYYTTNKQQMGPVSWDELRQLATKALLKPDDLVWTEGMAEWVKAVRQQGLFQESGTAASSVTTARTDTQEAPRKSSTRRRIDDELDEFDDDERRDRRKTRRKGAGSGGLKIGLIIGAVVLVVLLLSCTVVGVILIAFGFGDGGARPPVVVPGANTYIVNLAANQQNDRNFTFRQGQRVTVTVTTDQRQPDVDLHIVHQGRIIALDERVHPDCAVTFTAPANDTYTVRVRNLGPGPARSHVSVR